LVDLDDFVVRTKLETMLRSEGKGIKKQIQELADVLFGCGRKTIPPHSPHARTHQVALWQLIDQDGLQDADQY
jgi:hypothetical protein